jgi:hypothetical protein
MPKYFILYNNRGFKSQILKTEIEANSQGDAEGFFDKQFPTSTRLNIRKGIPFTKAQINREKLRVKYV